MLGLAQRDTVEQHRSKEKGCLHQMLHSPTTTYERDLQPPDSLIFGESSTLTMVQEIPGGREVQFCYQCLESTSSGRRLSFFSVSYPTTMTMVEGVAEMIRAERPFMRPQGPSSAISCLKVRMMELLPSTLRGKKTTPSERFDLKRCEEPKWTTSSAAAQPLVT